MARIICAPSRGMSEWCSITVFHRYPYRVEASPGNNEKWSVTWYHRTAGVSQQIGGLFDSAQEAMKFADEHGARHDFQPYLA